MKRELIPKPASRFLLVRCNGCNSETIVYSHSTKSIHCKRCNNLLVDNTGGFAVISAEILKGVDNP